MTLSAEEIQSVIELVRRDPEIRRQLQEALEIHGLLDLPHRMEQVERTLQQLTTIVSDLASAQRRAEERLERLEVTVQKLVDTAQENTQELRKLSRWQFGEEGRRVGEQYERRIQLRAFNLLQRGSGGPPGQPHVAERLYALLQRLPSGEALEDEEDPLLADLIWWKGDQYLVVEISQRVDRTDVLRALRRAATLQRTGADVIPVVIGEEWIADDTEDLAKVRAVEWKVGDTLSPGFLAFRRLSA